MIRRGKVKPSHIVHAPDAEYGCYPYCVELAYLVDRIAKPGEWVDCKACLRKLKKHPQYANYLFTEQRIDCRGTVWKAR